MRGKGTCALSVINFPVDLRENGGDGAMVPTSEDIQKGRVAPRKKSFGGADSAGC